MAKACICVLCGLPGSGKSYLCKQLIKHETFSFIHVCYDELLPWISNAQISENIKLKDARSEVVSLVNDFVSESSEVLNLNPVTLLNQVAVNSLQLKARQDLASSKHVVFLIDDNMQYKSMRYEYYKVARNTNIGFCVIHVESLFNICLERNLRRSKDEIVVRKSIDRIRSQFELPSCTKSSWESHVISVNTCENVDIDKCIALMQNAIENPVPALSDDSELSEQSRLTNVKNVAHQADILLRKLCKKIITSNNPPTVHIKNKAKLATEARKTILLELKSGIVDVCIYVLEDGTIDLEHLEEKLDCLMKAYV